MNRFESSSFASFASFEQLELRQLFSAVATAAAATTITGIPIQPIDGVGNNKANPTWGSVGADLLRVGPAGYTDGISSPAGASRPSAREISNVIATAIPDGTLNDRNMSAWVYAWGQFIDHDMDLTPEGGTEEFDVQVPTGDPSFDPNSTGTQVIPLSRSVFDPTTGTSKSNPRQQVNTITAYIDGSMIYGDDAARAAALRTFVGGKLKTSAGDLLPFNTDGFPNANDAGIFPGDQLFLAGDVRANENIELTAVQTLFVREHNRLADQIAAGNPRLSDEQIFQQARAIVIGEIQSITYNEWLPALMGANAMPAYKGYNPKVNPGIANEFSTAAFRFGHSMLGDDIDFLDNNGNDVTPPVSLAMAFFNPQPVEQEGIDPILKYLSSDNAQEIDNQVVDSLRNFLFGPPGSGGLDLASLNIQRGRDNGLEDYNSARAAYGLPKVTSFNQITSDPVLAGKLQELYGSVDNVDLWVGGLAEDHVNGSSLGPLFQRIISDQFNRLRAGDRFFFENIFQGKQLKSLENTTLEDIIARNSTTTNLQSNVFFFDVSIGGTVFNDKNANGQQDQREKGLSGWKVELLDDGGNVVDTTTTNANGKYSFDEHELGTYTLQVDTPDGSLWSQTTQEPEVQATRGMKLSHVDFGYTQANSTVHPHLAGVTVFTAADDDSSSSDSTSDGTDASDLLLV